MIYVTENWLSAFPNAHVGVLVMRGARNPRHHPELSQMKRTLEEELRQRYAGYSKADLKSLPVMEAYTRYYKGFRKTYHVLLQLRSVALEGKPLPDVAGLVEAMFMAEIQNGLLTAGHDLDRVHAPIALDASTGDEQYTLLNGRKQRLKADDMMLRDAHGVICSVIYGLDRRTAIQRDTDRVMFVVYAPAGIPVTAVTSHLTEIQDNVHVISPNAQTEHLLILPPTKTPDFYSIP
jgi:DNA/RNA-binding domain of Phe-tRNA-synthetase-like protein